MIQKCSRVFMLSFFFLDWTLCTRFQESRRFILDALLRDCPDGTWWHCNFHHYSPPDCDCRTIPNCPDGTWWHCNFHHYSPPDCDCRTIPTTTPIPIKCTSDVNCTGFNCPKQQYPFCEPNLDWNACGCTECTDDHHCNCSAGMVGHCRDDTFERKCECKQLPHATCKSDIECSTHMCTGNLSHSFCHEKKFLGYDFSSCDCRECSKDSDCHCQSGWIRSCRTTAFGNTCQCNQSNVHSTHSTTIITTKMATTFTTMTPVVSLDPSHESTTQPTKMTLIDVTKSTTDSTQTPQSTNTTIPKTNTSLIMVTLTTKPQGVRKCHICGDSPNSIPCDTRAIYMGNLQDCAPGENYCMTDLIHTGQSFPGIYKRCVTEDECRNKWLHQTSDLEHCTNYGNVLVEGHYSCHFCCTSDGCNSQQIPDKSTLYIKA